MKRFLSLMLVLLLGLSMVACSPAQDSSTPQGGAEESNIDPMELYTAALQKANSLTEVDFTMVMDMDMSAEGESVNMKVSMQTQVNKDKDMAITMSTEFDGESLDINMYYVDGYLYMELFGMKFKSKTSEEELGEMYSATDAQIEEVRAEAIKDMKAEKKGDVTTLTFKADGEAMSDFVEEMMMSMQAMEADSMEIGDISVSLDINKDQYVISQTMDIPMTMTLEGVEYTTTIGVSMSYNNPGQPVNIDFPDLSDYAEM